MPLPKHLSVLVLTAAIAACSGGGGSDNDETPEPEEPAPTEQVDRVSLTGLAIKGLAVGALVELFPLNESSGDFASTPVATATTDARGQYNFDFEDSTPPSGLVKLVIRYQDGAELQCDNLNSPDGDADACYVDGGNVGVGEFYPMPANFRLESVANFDSTVIDEEGSRIINVTAISYLMSALQQAYGGDFTPAEQAARAEAQIRAIFGMPASTDLTGDTPDNLVDDADEGDDVYGALNAAFVRIAKDRGETTFEVIDAFITAITSNGEVGQILWKSASDVPTLQALIDSAVELGNTTTEFDAIQAEIATASNDTYTNKVPPVVTLGSNRTVEPGASVTLSASAIQGISAQTAYSWSSNAPGLTFGTSASTTFTAPLTEGNYRITVQVTDGGTNLQSSSAMTLSVQAPTIVGSALDGDYHINYASRRLELRATPYAILLRNETEDGGVFNISTDGDGSVLQETADFSDTSSIIEGNLSDPNGGDIYTEVVNEPGDGFSAPLAVKASGIATINVPESAEVEAEYHIDSAFTLRLIPVSQDQSLFFGFGAQGTLDYALVSGEPDLTDLRFSGMENLNLALGRVNDQTGSDIIRDAAYNGFELEVGVRSSQTALFEVIQFDSRFEFDAQGNLQASENGYIQLAGSPGVDSVYIEADFDSQPLPEAETYSFNQGRFVSDDPQTEADDGAYTSALLASDQSAIVLTSLHWENDIAQDPAATDFGSGTVFYSSNNVGVFLRSPE